MAIHSILVGHLAISHGSPAQALILAVFTLAALALLGGIVARTGSLPFLSSRAASANLVALRRGADVRPRLWLVAHLDSKSQTVPMLWRIAAVASMVTFLVIMIAAVALMTVLYIASPHEHGAGTHIAGYVVHAASVMTAVSALPIIFCFIGNRSPGAADNASGVATVLIAAEMLDAGHNVGVLLTSAEELGLAGARAFVRDEQATGAAINCDTVDDSGEFIFMSSGRKPQRLAEALDSAARRSGITSRGASEGARLRSMLPGVLADNIAFSDAGWESLTVSRGNLATLARVHTARDRAGTIEGTGIAQAARLIVATVEELS